MKFKDVNNIVYEVPCVLRQAEDSGDGGKRKADNVASVKKQLSKQIHQDARNLRLIANNEPLDDNVFLRDIDGLQEPVLVANNTTDRSSLDAILTVFGNKGFPEFIQVILDECVETIVQILGRVTRTNQRYATYSRHGNHLDVEQRIRDAGLVDGSEIIAVPENHIEGELNVMPLLQDHASMNIRYSMGDSVNKIKTDIATKLRQDPTSFILFHKGVCLDDDSKLVQCLIEDYPPKFEYVHIRNLNHINERTKFDEGQFATVFLCRDETGKEIIIKGYKLVKDKKLQFFIGLLQEILQVKLLEDHPRIISISDFYQDENYFYLGMEYMNRGSIRKFMDENQRHLTETEIRHFTKQIIEGLIFMHGKKVLHRDIKCGSVLLNSNNEIKISGFGLSKHHRDRNSKSLLQGIQHSSTTLKHSNVYNWTAPEIIRKENYGVKADIWSFGAMIIEMVTGNPPYHNTKLSDMIIKIGSDRRIEYTPPEPISDSLNELITKCLNPNQEARPTAMKLLEERFYQDNH